MTYLDAKHLLLPYFEKILKYNQNCKEMVSNNNENKYKNNDRFIQY